MMAALVILVFTRSFVNAEEECHKGHMRTYTGRLNTTIGGYTCQRWDDQYPHTHNMSDKLFTERNMSHNYCRDLFSEDVTWCYTTNVSVRWEVCNITKCIPFWVNITFEIGNGEKNAAVSIICNISAESTSSVNRFSEDTFPVKDDDNAATVVPTRWLDLLVLESMILLLYVVY